MAGFPKVQDAPFGVEGLDAFHGKGQAGFGKDEFHIRSQAAVVSCDICRLFYFFRQSFQNFPDFLLFRRCHFRQVVVQFHGHHRFHEESLSGGGTVVDDAAEFVAVFFLHRHHVAAVPLGNDGVLQVGCLVLILQNVPKGPADSGLHRFLLGAYAEEL